MIRSHLGESSMQGPQTVESVHATQSRASHFAQAQEHAQLSGCGLVHGA